MTSTETMDLVVTRLFDAPVDRVWRAWTEPEQVMRWWGPVGFLCPVARMNVRAGGTSLVCMRSPEGQDFHNTWTYRTVAPGQLLEFVFDWADKDGTKVDPTQLGFPPDFPRNVRHVVTFEAKGANRTEMTVTEYGYTVKRYFDVSKAGLEQCLDKMAASFATD